MNTVSKNKFSVGSQSIKGMWDQSTILQKQYSRCLLLTRGPQLRFSLSEV